MKGALFLEPFGGLGNRMRVLVSAIQLSQHLDKELKIIWKTGADFNCPYEKLFKPNSFFQLHPARVTKKVFSSFNASAIKRKAIRWINRMNHVDLVICEQDLPFTFFKQGFDVHSLSAYQTLYIRSCEQFYGGA